MGDNKISTFSYYFFFLSKIIIKEFKLCIYINII
uniref:Uncharacterized protein n=1 Tax=Myoviridae sp. ctXXl13 TaxID=2827691 RepID=A0A8S5TJE9_9CAUD|nr:MAG TPA: hypothetical protein [Myoviridae sp. ctXXl13]